MIHLLNYDAARRPVLENVQVSVKIPAGKKAPSVRIVSPDMASERTIASSIRGGMVVFIVPRIATYSIAVVELR